MTPGVSGKSPPEESRMMFSFKESARLLFLISFLYVMTAMLVNFFFHHTLWGVERDGFFRYIQGVSEYETPWPWSRPPLFLMLGRAVNLLVDNGLRAGQIVSLFSAGALIFLGGMLAGLLDGRSRTAWQAAVLLACSEGILAFGMHCSTDILFAALSTAGFCFLLLPDPKIRTTGLAGVAFGLAYMTRYQGAVFLIGAAAWILVVHGRSRRGWPLIASYLIGAAIGVAPVVVYARSIMGAPPILTLLNALLRQPDLVQALGNQALTDRPSLFLCFASQLYGLQHFTLLAGVIPLALAIWAGWRIWKRPGKPGSSQLFLVLLGLVYLIGVGWKTSPYVGYPDSRRLFLPLLPIVFAYAATGLSLIRNAALRRMLFGAALAALLSLTAWYLPPTLSADPPPERRLVDRLQSGNSFDELLVIGWPIDLARYFPRFFYFEPDALLNEQWLIGSSEDGPARRHDLMIIPERKVGARWNLNYHDLLFCEGGYCAYRPKWKTGVEDDANSP